MVGFAILGVLLNVLDLTAGTHLTKDPDVALVLSIVLVPFGIGFYFIGAKTRGEPCWIAGETSPISDNVGGVNYFESVVIRALRGARHFALVEALPYPTQGSLAISFRSGNSVRPNHLFGRNFDHDYYFELPRERGAGRPIITTVFYRTPRGCPGCPACEPNVVSCS